MDSIVKFTNLYAHEHIAEKKTYQTDGVWKETNRNEFYGLLAFLFFQGFHPLPATRDYWRVTSLYNGNYARCMIRTYRRYLALMCFIKIVDFRAEDINDRLRKVRYLHDHLQAACKRLFIPGKCVSVDERMVKCKGRAPFTQYMPKKPVKWGFKVFAACDAQSSIVVNFEVYTGQQPGGENGLTHAVVMRLVSDVRAGSVIYTDNFYTSETLATSLRTKQISLVGTVRANRTGFPAVLRTDMKQFEKHAERGATRYVRNGDHLYQQWKDKRCVSMYSNIHQGHEHDTVTRNVKIDGAHQQMEVQRPMCIRDYNSSMGGVDTFDQLIETHRVLRKTKKYWKSLFLDMVDVCAVNAYRLFHLWQSQHPGVISRRCNLQHSDFRCNLIRQLSSIDEHAPPPKRSYRPVPVPQDVQVPVAQLHIPGVRKRKNCRNCTEVGNKQHQCVTYCTTCDVHLHITSDHDCYAAYHARHFP